MRRLLLTAAAVLLWLGVAAAPASAHSVSGVSATNFHTRLKSVTPAVPGLEVKVVTVDDIEERLPHYDLKGAVGGVFLPKDGQVNPIDVTQALAAGARRRGAKIFENTKVTRIITRAVRASHALSATTPAPWRKPTVQLSKLWEP